MKDSKMVVLMVLIVGTSISVASIFSSASAQMTTDNVTNATNATQGNVTGAGFTTDEEMSGKIAGFGDAP